MTIRTSIAAHGDRPAVRGVAAVAVLAAAAAVAGMATFGSFTDSTTPMDTTVEDGVVSLALFDATSRATVPYLSGGLLPGDVSRLPVDLANDGNTALSSVTLRSVVTASSVLDTDAVRGLQLTLQSCPRAWDAVGSGYSCAGTVADFYSGPIVMERELPGAASLNPGGVDHLLATVTLPETADDTFQGKRSSLSFTFTGVQREGTAR